MADESRSQWRPGTLWSALLLAGTCATWAIVSVGEGALSILVLHLALVGAALVVIGLLPEPRIASGIFAGSLALRTVIALAGWYTRTDGVAWSEGVGSDAIHYFNNSAMGLNENLLLLYSHRGFIGYNALATSLSIRLDGAPQFLCNLQLTLVAGALFASVVYGVVWMLGRRDLAVSTAMWVALHPGQIAISGVLLRDAVIGCFGWLMIYEMLRLRRSRALPGAAGWTALLALTGYWLFLLRSPSFIVFLGLGLAVAWATPSAAGERASRRRTAPIRRIAIAAVVLGGVAFLALVLSRNPYLQVVFSSGRTQEILQGRLEYTTTNSIAGQLLQYGWLLFGVAYIPLAFVMPFPFYSAWITDNPAGPPVLDVILGLGGLVNQFLLGLFIVGIIDAARRRDRLVTVAALFFPAFAFLVVATGGDTERYVLAHVFPLMVLVGMVGLRSLQTTRVAVISAWCACLLSLYVVYLGMKLGTGVTVILLTSICVLGYLVVMLVKTSAASSQHVPRVVRGRPDGKA